MTQIKLNTKGIILKDNNNRFTGWHILIEKDKSNPTQGYYIYIMNPNKKACAKESGYDSWIEKYEHLAINIEDYEIQWEAQKLA